MEMETDFVQISELKWKTIKEHLPGAWLAPDGKTLYVEVPAPPSERPGRAGVQRIEEGTTEAIGYIAKDGTYWARVRV